MSKANLVPDNQAPVGAASAARLLPRSPAITPLLAALLLFAGCSSTPSTQPSFTNRQENALRDPFGYSPNFDRNTINGGDLGHYDKDGMRKDLDHVFNP